MPPKKDDDPRPCAVYRCYSAVDQLIYIGSSVNIEQRMANLHALFEWPRVALHRHIEVWYPTRRAALDVEYAAIRTERPLFNLHGTGAPRFKPLVRFLRGPQGEQIPCFTKGYDWIVGEQHILARVERPMYEQALAACRARELMAAPRVRGG